MRRAIGMSNSFSEEETGTRVWVESVGELDIPGPSSPEEVDCSGIGEMVLSSVVPKILLFLFLK